MRPERTGSDPEEVERRDEYRDPIVEAYAREIDGTLLDKNLRLSPEERLLQLMRLQKLHHELRAAGRRLRGEE